METWDSEDHPQTRTLYYCGKSESTICGLCGGTGATVYDVAPDEDGAVICDRCGGSGRGDPSTYKVFYSPQFDEELERVAPRTMEAYEHALTLPDWDFMARTHSSTYVHKRNLVDFCETLHRENLLSGLLVTGERPFLWGGGSFIMSRDVIEQFVANKEKWNMGIMEDNGMTDLANELGIPLNGNGRMASIDGQGDGSYQVTTYGIGEGFRFTDWNDVNKAGPHYYWRCKQDLRRHEDLVIFRQLHKHLK